MMEMSREWSDEEVEVEAEEQEQEFEEAATESEDEPDELGNDEIEVDEAGKWKRNSRQFLIEKWKTKEDILPLRLNSDFFSFQSTLTSVRLTLRILTLSSSWVQVVSSFRKFFFPFWLPACSEICAVRSLKLPKFIFGFSPLMCPRTRLFCFRFSSVGHFLSCFTVKWRRKQKKNG